MAQIKKARASILEALKKSTFAMAHFGNGISEPYNQGVDRICKVETRLYRETWLIPPLIQALRAIDPCKGCGGSHVGNCEACKGTGVAGGLPFDPFQLSQDAAKNASNMKEIQRNADELSKV